MKKIALALVASTMLVGAASANIGTGFYLGAAVGYGATNSKAKTGTAAAGDNASTTDFGGNAANVGIHGGYGWVSGCLYFGGEVAYTFENTKVRETDAVGATQLKRNGYFNAALRAGYLFTPSTMGYVRLGGNWGKWKLENNTANAAALNQTGSKNRLSFAPGVGLETAIHKNVFLRVEYSVEFGPSIIAENANNTVYTKVNTVRSHSGKVGLSYKF